MVGKAWRRSHVSNLAKSHGTVHDVSLLESKDSLQILPPAQRVSQRGNDRDVDLSPAPAAVVYRRAEGRMDGRQQGEATQPTRGESAS